MERVGKGQVRLGSVACLLTFFFFSVYGRNWGCCIIKVVGERASSQHKIRSWLSFVLFYRVRKQSYCMCYPIHVNSAVVVDEYNLSDETPGYTKAGVGSACARKKQ